MADFDSSLPIRTENAGDVIAKISDATVTSQQLKVNADGSIDTNFAPGAQIEITDGTDTLAVNTDGSLNAVVTATDLDIRDLAFATDKVDVTGSEVSLDATTLAALENITVSATDLDIRDLAFATDKVDVTGSEVSLDATTLAALENITVSATDLDIRDLAFATDKVDVTGSEVSLDATTLAALENITVSATDLDIRDLAFATDTVDVSGSSVTVTATNLDVRDLTHVSDSVKVGDGTDFLSVNTDGSINVTIVDASPGTAINDYNTAAAVAASATSTHTYTSTGNFYLNQIEATASGKMKIEVQVNAVTKFVQFNSTAQTNMSIHIDNPLLATTGQTVTIIRTNLDKQAQDLYSTISGYNA